ncbi:hypothetical protein PLICRDRAFT_29388 [Plicaturopsis crispa FD-325 SS-3]|nr:hypothetical protein PLICRDRAFT_29388 [Plicaturopsis crispa FD-325 SS-3]
MELDNPSDQPATPPPSPLINSLFFSELDETMPFVSSLNTDVVSPGIRPPFEPEAHTPSRRGSPSSAPFSPATVDPGLVYAHDMAGPLQPEPFPIVPPPIPALRDAFNFADPQNLITDSMDIDALPYPSDHSPVNLDFAPSDLYDTQHAMDVDIAQDPDTSHLSYYDDASTLQRPPSVASYLGSAALPSPRSLNADDLEWDNNGTDGKRRVLCPYCGTWIQTGSYHKNTMPLTSHALGKLCRLGQQRFELARAQQARNRIFPSTSTASGSMSRARTAPPASPSRGTRIEFQIETPSKFMAGGEYDMEIDSSSDSMPSPSSHRPSPDAPPSHAPEALPATYECPGIHLDWPNDHFFETYPFHRHDLSLNALGYKFCAVEKNGTEFRVRSDVCEGQSAHGAICRNCADLTKTVERLAAMARDAAPHTNHRFLTYEQLRDMLRDRNKDIHLLRLDSLNVGKKCASLLKQLDDHRRFLMAVATGDVPRLQQLVRQALKENASVSKIVSKIEDGLVGTYVARGYEEVDRAVSTLVLRLGGRKLLYALSHYIALPSVRALQRAEHFVRIMPSIGMPKYSDVAFNMREVIMPKATAAHSFRTGVSVLWDEVSQEEVACYLPHLDSVGGLCREHCHLVDVRLSTFESAVKIARALANDTVHYGKEASVIAIASFGKVLRGAHPVLVSSTCKQEMKEGSADILSTVLEAWYNICALYFGPIWCFASDGDAERRAMVHRMFMKRAIDSRHTLYKFLGRLPGLNLLVGDRDITASFDWKHLIKRIGRLLRTFDGMVVGNTIINRETLRQHLCRSDDLTAHGIDMLLNPADAQDVPRAIDLLEAVSSISTLPTASCSPSELQEIRAINIIGEMFAAFMRPFISPTWSLTEQVTSLSKFAHMSFVLFREYRGAFMPHQLYGDMQTTVKNIMFCIAKQQDLDGTQPLYLFWDGDDRLEMLFGRLRMQGRHNPNFSFKELADRLGAAVDIDAILSQFPELDEGHRRLSTTRTEGADHLNPESWIGDVVAHNVDLESAWLEGQSAALEALHHINLTADFNTLFDESRELDLMRPFGNNVYPGVSTDFDRSREPPSSGQPIPPSSPSSSQAAPDVSTQPSSTTEQLNVLEDIQAVVSTLDDEELDVYSAELGSHDSLLPVEHPAPNLPPDSPTVTMTEEDLLEHVEFEDALEDPPTLTLPSPPEVKDRSAWIEYQGKKYHKASICRLVITPDYIRKSHERALRVQGFTMDLKSRDFLNTDNIIDPDCFVVGDLYATLICCDDCVSLAFMKCIAIREKDIRVTRVKSGSLAHPAGGVKLTGQILDMQTMPTALYYADATEHAAATSIHMNPSGQSHDDPQAAASEGQAPAYTWIWTGAFVKLDLEASKGPSPVGKANLRKTLAVTMNSYLCEPINPRVLDVKDYLPEVKRPADLNTAGLTWEVSDMECAVLISRLWDIVHSQNALSLLPAFRANKMFPYRMGTDDKPALIAEEGSLILEARHLAAPNEKFRCYQCLTEVDSSKARLHVGKHILNRMRGVEERLPGGPVGHPMPCGFCGRAGIISCSEVYLTKGKHPQAHSNCIHFRKFNYGPSLVSNHSSPCTNVPIACTFPGCQAPVGSKYLTAVWKYNMPEHIRSSHPGHSFDGIESGAPIPNDLARAMLITREEEEWMKIPASNIPRKILPSPSEAFRAPAASHSTRSRSKKHATAATDSENPVAKRRRRK